MLPQQITVKGCVKGNSATIDLVFRQLVIVVVVVVVMVADFVVYSISV